MVAFAKVSDVHIRALSILFFIRLEADKTRETQVVMWCPVESHLSFRRKLFIYKIEKASGVHILILSLSLPFASR